MLAFTTVKLLHITMQGMMDRINTADIDCVTINGMQNQVRYHPRFADPMLQQLAEEWRVRVLTPQDIKSLVNHGFVSPVELPNTYVHSG